ncbi:MAG: tetratricopeptide repeat protein [Hormoscilla sp. GUM202]|nr:tetratricopeptide repeat protein [Hormoscilla sp. GUM202]
MKRLLLTIFTIFLVWGLTGQVTFAQSSIWKSQFIQLNELNQKAFGAIASSDFARAELYLTQMLEIAPDNPAILSNRGNIRLSQNKLDEALADYNRAVELAPYVPDPYLNRGIAWEALGMWQKAIADYDRVLELDPNDAEAYNNRGNAKGGLGDWPGAVADFQKAFDLAPNYAFARANYALALYQAGNPEEATGTIRNLVKKYPQFADMRAALTAVLWAEGKAGDAESNWVAVVGLDGRYQDIDWVRNFRRWPPLMVDALEQFLN